MGYLTCGATAGGKTYDLLPCPHCGGEAEFRDGSSTKPYIRCKECGCRTWGSHAYDKLVAAWNRRAERTWHDFSDELPPVGASVLCRGKNGALYVGKPVTLNDNVTRKVWVPRGDQYRSPEKWMAVNE